MSVDSVLGHSAEVKLRYKQLRQDYIVIFSILCKKGSEFL